MSTVSAAREPADPRSGAAPSSTGTVATAGLHLAGRHPDAAPPAAGAPRASPTAHPRLELTGGPSGRNEPRPIPRGMGAGAVAEQVWLRAASLRPGCALVAISSADGGVGRSTLAATLGSLLALACPDPVIAVDMSNRAWGGLAARVGRTQPGSVWDTVRDIDTLTSRDQVQRWTQQSPTGLQALVGEVEMAGKRRPPTHSESMTVVKALHPLYPLAVLDLAVAEIRGVWITLAWSAAPVLVARATTDSLQHTMRLLAQMRAVGLTELADNALLVVMTTSPSTPRGVKAVARQAAGVAGGLLTVPYDPDLARPVPIDPRRLRRATRRALVDVAAAVLARCPAEPDPAPLHAPSTRGAPELKERA